MTAALKNTPGLWADTLSSEEVEFSKDAGRILSGVTWAKPILGEEKVSRALGCTPDPNRSYDARLEIKSALFEVRFALAIHSAGCTAEYEHNTDVGNSSVDFLVHGKENNRNWLVELTSLRDSEATKENSWESGNFFGYSSISNPNENSPEVRDIVKAQQAILHKAANRKGEPIKFPLPDDKTYNVIAVDVRALSLGHADQWDFHNIVYGSRSLTQIENGVYCRTWRDNDGNQALLTGIFDPAHPDPKTTPLRERVHAVAFISESKYTVDEINSKIRIFPNPHLISNEEMKGFCTLFPLSAYSKKSG